MSANFVKNVFISLLEMNKVYDLVGQTLYMDCAIPVKMDISSVVCILFVEITHYSPNITMVTHKQRYSDYLTRFLDNQSGTIPILFR